MARDSSGTKNQPQYSSSGVSAQAADLSEVSNYAATVGNRKAGTSSQRTTLTGTDLWDGLEWHDTTDGGRYEYIGGGWVRRQLIRLGRARLTSPAVVAVAAPAWMDVLTLIATSTGGACMVEVAANLYNPNSHLPRTSGLRVLCDGTQVDDIWQLDIPDTGGVSAGVAGVVRAESTPGAGSHTWTFQANASAAASVAIRSAVMTVLEV